MLVEDLLKGGSSRKIPNAPFRWQSAKSGQTKGAGPQATRHSCQSALTVLVATDSAVDSFSFFGIPRCRLYIETPITTEVA